MKTPKNEKKILGVTGMPGAGKSLVVEVAKEKGYTVIIMGDEIREEAKRRQIPATPENLGKIMLELREKEGADVVAKRCVWKIKEAKQEKVVVEGIRSLNEVEAFKKFFKNFQLVAVHASPKTRFERLIRRRRSDDPKNWENFVKRDLRELNVGIGKVIAVADYMIVNEGTIEEAKKIIRRVLEKIDKNE